MTISRRGLFGALLGGIATGYAAKVAPAYATYSLDLTADGYVSGFVSPNAIIRSEAIIDLERVASNLSYIEERTRINDAVAAARAEGDVLFSGPIVSVTGGCTRDGLETAGSSDLSRDDRSGKQAPDQVHTLETRVQLALPQPAPEESTMRYFQCQLSEVGGTGRTVGWIEERGAKVGAEVEMKDFGGARYRVDHVADFGIEAKALAEKQARDRGSLPSLQTA